MKFRGWRVRIGLLLVLASAILYATNFLIFHDTHDLFFYISIDIAFVPIEVLLVVMVIEAAIGEREKNIMLEKLNMVIGAFFSEVGTDLLKDISEFDSRSGEIKKSLIIKDNWSQKDFLEAEKFINDYNYKLDIEGTDPNSISFLKNTQSFLINKRKFLLALLENPNLLEHETFTELLRAVFHLTEELENREDMTKLPESDYKHLNLDTERAYNLLIYEWLQYMEHLMNNYPYLFSLALRTNPFDPDAKVEIQDS
ncbi:hypothetical protein [Methanobacterium paludis]|uniref:Uncharacterized protein n=1 Tax=Methanobacterium paludis (strain DSM 25820 / JCM 18151 / SWAN1) TaxID=868131 RepID=F6D662_METPW|nr:hypothetical protein [Methanobacterium paludis]AEG18275.1 hypothetical protein MSWAN_1258 [Methanobacterium paludis]